MDFPLNRDALDAIGLTLVLATSTTLILLVLATPLAWWLSQTQSRWRVPIGALATLPTVQAISINDSPGRALVTTTTATPTTSR